MCGGGVDRWFHIPAILLLAIFSASLSLWLSLCLTVYKINGNKLKHHKKQQLIVAYHVLLLITSVVDRKRSTHGKEVIKVTCGIVKNVLTQRK